MALYQGLFCEQSAVTHVHNVLLKFHITSAKNNLKKHEKKKRAQTNPTELIIRVSIQTNCVHYISVLRTSNRLIQHNFRGIPARKSKEI